ncbi:hypothetical protein ACEK07_17520 [Alcanivoracaceae bacterium MT1]
MKPIMMEASELLVKSQCGEVRDAPSVCNDLADALTYDLFLANAVATWVRRRA